MAEKKKKLEEFQSEDLSKNEQGNTKDPKERVNQRIEEFKRRREEKKAREQLIIRRILIALSVFAVFFYLIRVFTTNPNEWDLNFYRKPAYEILAGRNPYSHEPGFNMENYPPGIFLWYALLILIFGDTNFGLKIPVYIFTWLTAIVIKYLADELLLIYHEYKTNHVNEPLRHKPGDPGPVEIKIPPHLETYFPWVASLLFLFDFFVIERTTNGQNDSFPTFFLVLGLYFFLKHKDLSASLCFAISLLLKLVPLFILPFLFFFLYINKEYKRILKYLVVIGLIYFIVFLPFLIDDFTSTIRAATSVTSRHSQIGSYHEFVFYFYAVQIDLGLISFSFWFFIQLISYSLIFFAYYKRENSLDALFVAMSAIYLALPVLTTGYGQRYFVWAAPVFYIYILSKKRFGLIIPMLFLGGLRQFFVNYVFQTLGDLYGFYYLYINNLISPVFIAFMILTNVALTLYMIVVLFKSVKKEPK